MRPRVWYALLVLVLTSTAVTVLVHHQRAGAQDAVNRGPLTTVEYAHAAAIARAEVAKEDAKASRAVAYLVDGKVQVPNLAGRCTSGHLLVVSLVGTFPHIAVGGFAGPGSPPTGPDEWVTMKADPASDEPCLVGISFGRFAPPVDYADLGPAL
jgi:hypothetical protein